MHFLSNLLSSLRNAKASRLSHIVFIQPQNAIPKAIFDILTLLRKNGIIRGFSCIEISISGKVKFMIYLKYDESGKSVIDSLFLVSKPSRRIYMSSSAIWQPQTTTGFFILSTPIGICTDIEARRYNVGGEILFGVT